MLLCWRELHINANINMTNPGSQSCYWFMGIFILGALSILLLHPQNCQNAVLQKEMTRTQQSNDHRPFNYTNRHVTRAIYTDSYIYSSKNKACLCEIFYTASLVFIWFSKTALVLGESAGLDAEQHKAGQIRGLEAVRKSLLVRDITSGTLTSR